ncbi:hypothetical protein AGLY_001458 [Aphis glycines]|uniref:Uncharacterized protein n=1 Tax=Aphis glycines TaxID=307491 RepID=A0A6G0U6N8_APHGL|nr:hypothetical protein AGLY_001458 [Aphis glycines]
MDLDADEVERWLCEKAPQDLVDRVIRARLQHRTGSLTISRAKRGSMTSEMFNTWLASSPIKRSRSPNRVTRSSGEWRHHLGLLDEGELFMELIRDVSNELDIDVLCHKILVNVGILTRADRGSLFLVRGRHLVAKLFDVTVDTEKFMENLVPNFQNLVIKEKNFTIFQPQNYLQIFATLTYFGSDEVDGLQSYNNCGSVINRTTMDLDADEVERWLCEKAPQDLVDRVIRARLQHRTGSLTISRAKRGSMTSEMFNTWLASSPIKRSRSPNRVTRSSGEWRHHLGLLDEGELFMELIRDVSNELDIDVLCHKILVNVGILTRADRGSLFLVRGRHLVAKLFDVTVDTGKNLFMYVVVL